MSDRPYKLDDQVTLDVVAEGTRTLEPMLLTASEAAQVLRIGKTLLSELTASGEIQCVRPGWRVLYDPADLRAWIERSKTTGNAQPRRDRSKEKQAG